MSVRAWVNAAVLGGGLGLLGTLVASWLMPITSLLWVILPSINETERDLGFNWEKERSLVPYYLFGIAFVFVLAVVPGTLGGAFLGVLLRLAVLWRGRISLYVGAIAGLVLGALVGLGVDRTTSVLLGGPPSVKHFDSIDAAALSLAVVFGGAIGAVLTWVLQRGYGVHRRDVEVS